MNEPKPITPQDSDRVGGFDPHRPLGRQATPLSAADAPAIAASLATAAEGETFLGWIAGISPFPKTTDGTERDLLVDPHTPAEALRLYRAARVRRFGCVRFASNSAKRERDFELKGLDGALLALSQFEDLCGKPDFSKECDLCEDGPCLSVGDCQRAEDLTFDDDSLDAIRIALDANPGETTEDLVNRIELLLQANAENVALLADDKLVSGEAFKTGDGQRIDPASVTTAPNSDNELAGLVATTSLPVPSADGIPIGGRS